MLLPMLGQIIEHSFPMRAIIILFVFVFLAQLPAVASQVNGILSVLPSRIFCQGLGACSGFFCFQSRLFCARNVIASSNRKCFSPGGPGADEVQVGMSGGGNGVGSVPMCAARLGGGSTSPAPAPTYYYIYGSIAWHPDVADVWMIGNYRSSNEAEREALAACQRAMGG